MKPVRLIILETDSDETKLFVNLVGRGEHADIPYYWSARSHNIQEGWVMFEDLSCDRDHMFRVGLAGNKIIVGSKHGDIYEVTGWLKAWGIKVTSRTTVDLNSKQEAHAFLEKLRRESMPADQRRQVTAETKRQIRKLLERVDAELLAQ